MNGENAQAIRTRCTNPVALSLGIAMLCIALPAQAAEGGLNLLPDFTRTLPGLILVFAVLVYPLNALLFRPIIKALDERDERIAGTRTKAEKLSQDAQAVLEEYETAVRQAREEAERSRRGKLEEARARMIETTVAARGEAERKLEEARVELASTLDGARATLRSQADDLAREAAARVLGRAL